MFTRHIDPGLVEISKYPVIISGSQTPHLESSSTELLKALLGIRSWLQCKVALGYLLDIVVVGEGTGLLDSGEPEHAVKERGEKLVKFNVSIGDAEICVSADEIKKSVSIQRIITAELNTGAFKQPVISSRANELSFSGFYPEVYQKTGLDVFSAKFIAELLIEGVDELVITNNCTNYIKNYEFGHFGSLGEDKEVDCRK